MQDSDMHEMIEALGTLRATGQETPAGAATVASDLDRGRRALVVRRRRRAARAGVTAAAVLTAVTVAVVSRPAGDSGVTARPAGGTHAPAATHASQAQAAPRTLELVAYTGAQPTGFHVDSIPAGWKFSWSDAFSFVAVPESASATQDPGDVDFSRGIAVMLQGDQTIDPAAEVTQVTVGGRTARLVHSTDGFHLLFFPDSSGHAVLVQVADRLGVTDAQLVRFAQGVTVTGQVRAAAG